MRKLLRITVSATPLLIWMGGGVPIDSHFLGEFLRIYYHCGYVLDRGILCRYDVSHDLECEAQMICTHTAILWESMNSNAEKVGVVFIKHDVEEDIPKVVRLGDRYFLHQFDTLVAHYCEVKTYTLDEKEIAE